jgi:general secretion pathway protein N
MAAETPKRGFPWRWLIVGVVGYFVFLIATFPAQRLTARLQTAGVQAAGVSGSVWNGRAAALQVRGMALGPTEWRISPWRLFTGTLSADVKSKRDDGYFDGNLRASLGGAISVRDLRASLPIAALNALGLPGGGMGGWSGTLQLKLDELALTAGWPSHIKGDVSVANLVGPPQQPTPLGSYRVLFPAPNAPANQVAGAVLSSEDSPLDVVGTLRLEPNRNYVIDAQVATRPTAPASITKALQFLGPPDEQGRRPFSVAGVL